MTAPWRPAISTVMACWSMTNKIVSEGDWKDGKLNGDGSAVHSDGSRYEGEWQNDLPERRRHSHARRRQQSRKGSSKTGKLTPGFVQIDTPVPVGLMPVPMAVAIERKSITEPSALNAFSGKKLTAVDGATLNLAAIEGGIERDINHPPANWKRPRSFSSMTSWAR